MKTIAHEVLKAAGVAVVFANVSLAADFTWQGTASSLWNTSDANWSGAGSVWTNGVANNAVFGSSSAKSITADAVTLGSLTFNADGYAIGGGPLYPSGSVSVATNVAAGLTAPIVHSATNLVLNKTGPGLVALNPGSGSGSNIFASLKVSQGTVHVLGGTNVVTLVNGQPESNPAFWVTGGTLLVGGGLLKSTGNMYGRVSDFGALIVTNGYVDLSSYSELLNGHNAPGVVTVAGTGTLDVKTLRVSQNTYAANLTAININTGGTLRVNVFNLDAGSLRNGTVNFNGGTVVPRDSNVQFDFLGTTSVNWRNIAVNVLAGGAIVDNNTFSFTLRQNMAGTAGDGGFTKLNSGTLYLRGTNTFTGGFRVRGGAVNIIRDHNLGAVPSAPTTNVFFLANSTLQSSDNHALAANRTLWITNEVTATIDPQSYTQMIYGSIMCAETSSTLYKAGSGTVVLDPGAQTVSRFGTLQVTAGTLVVASGTNLVTRYCNVQNGPGIRVSGGTLLVSGGVLMTTTGQYINVDGGHLLVTNGLVDVTSCDQILNAIGSTCGYTTVSGSGVIAANQVRISQNGGNPSNNVVNVSTGGVLRLRNFYIDVNAVQKGYLILNGGTVQARADVVDFLGTTPTFVGNINDRWLTNILVRVREGGALFNTAGYSISIKQPLVSDVLSDGGLTKFGAGTLSLLSTNAYTGATRVLEGTLKLGASNTLWTAGTASVSSGAVLDVNGKVQALAGLGGSGWVTNNASLTVVGTIAPGSTNDCGTLTLASACSLSGTLAIDVATNGVCDQLSVRGALNVSNLDLSVTNPNALDKFSRYTVATCTEALDGAAFASAPLPNRWLVRYDTSNRRVYLTYNFGTLLAVR